MEKRRGLLVPYHWLFAQRPTVDQALVCSLYKNTTHTAATASALACACEPPDVACIQEAMDAASRRAMFSLLREVLVYDRMVI